MLLNYLIFLNNFAFIVLYLQILTTNAKLRMKKIIYLLFFSVIIMALWVKTAKNHPKGTRQSRTCQNGYN